MGYVVTALMRGTGAKTTFTVDDFEITNGYFLCREGQKYTMVPLDMLAMMEWIEPGEPGEI